MASSFSTNLGIEKPATGELSGSWGDVTNFNFDIFDRITGAADLTASDFNYRSYYTSSFPYFWAK